MQEKHLYLLFDFDGVIANSFPVTFSLAHQFCKHFKDKATYLKTFEGQLYDSFDEIMASDHGDECDHHMDWQGAYDVRFQNEVEPFPGMIETLRSLGSDYNLDIVSSSKEELIHTFLKKHGVDNLFTDILGLAAHRQKVHKFNQLFRSRHAPVDQYVFITDTLGDIREANEVGVASIGVSWGFHDRGTLKKGNPVSVVDSPQELITAIRTYFHP